MTLTLISVFALLSGSPVATPAQHSITITLHNESGKTAENIEIRAEAFNLDVLSLKSGATFTKTVPLTTGNCGLVVSFTTGGVKNVVGKPVPLPDKVADAKIHVRINGPETVQVSVEEPAAE